MLQVQKQTKYAPVHCVHCEADTWRIHSPCLSPSASTRTQRCHTVRIGSCTAPALPGPVSPRAAAQIVPWLSFSVPGALNLFFFTLTTLVALGCFLACVFTDPGRCGGAAGARGLPRGAGRQWARGAPGGGLSEERLPCAPWHLLASALRAVAAQGTGLSAARPSTLLARPPAAALAHHSQGSRALSVAWQCRLRRPRRTAAWASTEAPARARRSSPRAPQGARQRSAALCATHAGQACERDTALSLRACPGTACPHSSRARPESAAGQASPSLVGASSTTSARVPALRPHDGGEFVVGRPRPQWSPQACGARPQAAALRAGCRRAMRRMRQTPWCRSSARRAPLHG